MNIIVTGASGYIGSRFVSYALMHNHHIISASRQRLDIAQQWMEFDLNNSAEIILPEEVDAVIHLGANTSSAEDYSEHEVAAAKKMQAAANNCGAKFIFVSSQAAREDAPTIYGRTKWRIEKNVLTHSGFVIRLGQVYGGQKRGLFGTLVNLVERLPVLPAFIPSPFIQPIHVDDCAMALLRFVELKDKRSDVYCLGSVTPVSFTDFLQAISNNRLRCYKFFVPTPVFLISFFSKILGEQLANKFGLYRLNSLFDLPLMDTENDMHDIGIELRPLFSGMHRSGDNRRRRLIHEGTALLTYILREKPTSTLVRRYVRMVEKLKKGEPLAISTWLLRWPASLVLLDNPRASKTKFMNEFIRRVDAATVLAEASGQGAVRFLGAMESMWKITSLFKIITAVTLELVWNVIRLILPKFIFRSRTNRGHDV